MLAILKWDPATFIPILCIIIELNGDAFFLGGGEISIALACRVIYIILWNQEWNCTLQMLLSWLYPEPAEPKSRCL
jgi:hypothetical protein